MTFDEGDFNYDGNVDFNDMVLLAQRYNTALAAPPAAAPVVASALTAPVFSTSRIATTTKPRPVVKTLQAAPRKPSTQRPARRDDHAG
jgi:hypothetical protein